MSNQSAGTRDVILRINGNTLQRINELHPVYDTLQYPLLFLKGTPGWSVQMKQEKRITMMQYYCFHIMTCPGNYLLLARRLLQQFLVDIYAKIENERLLFIRCQQGRLRVDNCQNLRDTVASGDRDPRNLGQGAILPSSFVVSPRYMFERQQDTMIYVRLFG